MRVFCYFLIGEHLKCIGFCSRMNWNRRMHLRCIEFCSRMNWNMRIGPLEKGFMLLSRDLLENICFSVSDLARLIFFLSMILASA